MKTAWARLIETEFWKSSKFWLTVAAIVLPFGWVLFALKFEPVRVRAVLIRPFLVGTPPLGYFVASVATTGRSFGVVSMPFCVSWPIGRSPTDL